MTLRNMLIGILPRELKSKIMKDMEKYQGKDYIQLMDWARGRARVLQNEKMAEATKQGLLKDLPKMKGGSLHPFMELEGAEEEPPPSWAQHVIAAVKSLGVNAQETPAQHEGHLQWTKWLLEISCITNMLWSDFVGKSGT